MHHTYVHTHICMVLQVQVEAEMQDKLRVLADAQQRLDAIIAQQAARAAARNHVPVDGPVHTPACPDTATQRLPTACMRADVAVLGAFLFGRLAGVPGAMPAP